MYKNKNMIRFSNGASAKAENKEQTKMVILKALLIEIYFENMHNNM